MSTPTQTRMRVAIVIFENSARDLARAYRGLMAATEFVEAGDDVTVVYDGSGVDTLGAAASPDDKLHTLVEKLRPVTQGACGVCAQSHGVKPILEEHNWSLLTQYKGHASMREPAAGGYQVLSF